MEPERQSLIRARRVVVKVGTTVVTRPDGGLALGRLGALVEGLAALRAQGREVLLVSSGAVGLGAERLGFERRPVALVDRQACAAAGQGALMALYSSFFERVGLVCAQVLLTESDFHVRKRYVNLAATLQRLLALGAVPIINENDTVSTDEIALRKGRVFSDNDRLAALVATGLGCDALVLLSDVESVYTAPPREPSARRVGVWQGQEVRFGALSAGGRGGMPSKVASASLAARGGVAAVIASGEPGVLGRVFAGEDVGTLFPASPGRDRWRQWLAFATVPAGRVVVDVGARQALIERHASLLPVGVKAVSGDFEPGHIVSIVCDDEEFARGRVLCGSSELRALVARGARGRPVVHRDGLVVLVEET